MARTGFVVNCSLVFLGFLFVCLRFVYFKELQVECSLICRYTPQMASTAGPGEIEVEHTGLEPAPIWIATVVSGGRMLSS